MTPSKCGGMECNLQRLTQKDLKGGGFLKLETTLIRMLVTKINVTKYLYNCRLITIH